MVGRIVAVVGFGAFIVWDVWEGLGNLLGLPAYYEAMGVAESTPWLILVAGLAIPVGVAIAGLWSGWRRRSAVEATLVYVLALAIQSCLALSLIAAEQAWRARVLLGVLG